LVVDVAVKSSKALEMAASGGSVVALPSGEDKPQADILILLGLRPPRFNGIIIFDRDFYGWSRQYVEGAKLILVLS
jgi:hypothetical protein